MSRNIIGSREKSTPKKDRKMAAVGELVACWLPYSLEQSRLVLTPVSSGLYSWITSMLCKTSASPIQPVFLENLLLENFILWEKSSEICELFTQFSLGKFVATGYKKLL